MARVIGTASEKLHPHPILLTIHAKLLTPTHQSINQKLEALQAATQHLVRIKNEKLLKDHNVTYDKLGTGKCPGFAWKLSQIRCRHNSNTNLGTLRLSYNKDNNSIHLTQTHCYSCRSDAHAVEFWMDHNKYNGDNTRLCSRPNCLEPLLTALDCEQHYNQRREGEARRLEGSMQDHNDKTIQQHQGYTKRQRLWNILSPANMRTFYTTLSNLRVKPWSPGDDWAHVAESMTTKEYNGPKIFHTDTETFQVLDRSPSSDGQRILQPLEISILDRSGKDIFSATVNYQLPVWQLMDGCSSQFLAKACEIYSVKSASEMTTGMTPEQIRAALYGLGFQKEGCILVEHSSSSWDWRSLCNLLGGDHVPAISLKTFSLFSMLGYTGTKALQKMFILTYPGSVLNKCHYRAL